MNLSSNSAVHPTVSDRGVKWLMGLIWALGTVFCALRALYGWRLYDDEGFFLYQSIQLLEGHTLYTEVFTPYGSVFYLANTGLVWVFGPSMLASRLATTGLAVLSAAFLYAIGRRFLPPLASMVPAMAWLLMASANLNESLHPGWYTTALLLAALYLLVGGARPWSGGRLFAVGLLVGLLAGFKGNVAAYTSFGFAAFFLTAFRCPRSLKWLAAAGSVGFLLFLMRAHLWPPLGGIYPLLLVLAVIVVFYSRSPLETRRSGLRPFAWWLAGTAGGTLLWLVPTLWISGLGPTWEVMVELAARHPLIFSNLAEGPIPFVTVLVAVGIWMGLLTGRESRRRVLVFVVAGFCGLSMFVTAVLGIMITEVIYVLPLSVILVGVWMRDVLPGDRIVASLVGWQAVFQVFHIYPVLGTQMIYGTPFIVLLVAACTYALLTQYGLAENGASVAAGGPVDSPETVGIGARTGVEEEPKVDRYVLRSPLASKYLGCRSIADLVFSYAAVGLAAFLAAGVVHLVKTYRRGLPISALSARGVRFQPELAPQLEAVIRYLRENTTPGEPLFTMPGMCSFYIWTGRPSVTTHNFTSWGILTPQMQESTAAGLSRVRFVVVSRKSLFWKVIVDPPRPASNRSTVLRDRGFRDYVPLPSEVWLGRKIPKKDLLLEIWVRRKDPPAGPAPR